MLELIHLEDVIKNTPICGAIYSTKEKLHITNIANKATCNDCKYLKKYKRKINWFDKIKRWIYETIKD